MAIEVLGPPLAAGNAALAPRDRVVLGVLAVRRGRVVMPGQIADAVWGERPPASWPKQVQICVARLRKVLGPAAIESATGGYRLVVTGDEVDVDRFERLVEDGRGLVATGQPHRAASSFAAALALWRGTPFEDLVEWEPGCSESARLDQLRLSAEEELLDARLAAGEHVAVAADAEPLVASEPLRERRWEILVTAQYRCGRQAEALRSLARVRRLLVEQLGVDPGPGLVELETAILHHDGSLAPPPPPAPLMATCPYKGLAAYETADAEGFFGRAAEVSACIDRLRETTLLVVTGPSGCGKSSLLRAGLVPAVLRLEQPVVTFVPGSDPDAAMSEALAGAVGRPTLVIDQFEELFTLAAVDAGQVFCRRVARYAQDAPVIIGVRADHVAGLSVDPQLARLAERGMYLLSPLSGVTLREAIEQPAIHAGYQLERGLVDVVARDAEGEPGALPMLSHALAETWRGREGAVMTLEGYRRTGEMRGAIARSADQLYDSLPAGRRTVLRGVLLRLVALSPDGTPVRCRVATRTLTGDREREQVVALLVRARLVTAGVDTVELAHESMAKAWPRLQSWLEDDAAGQRILRHLAAAATGWDTLERPDSELYRGPRLDTTLEWQAVDQPDLTVIEAAFLDASRALAESERSAQAARVRRDARQNRRVRRALVGVALFAVAVLIAGAIAVQQRRRADVASRDSAIRALVSNATSMRSARRDLAALLEVEAHRLAPSAATESALLGVFTSLPGIGTTRRFDEAVFVDNEGVVLPDGRTIAGVDVNGNVHLIDVSTGNDVRQLGDQRTPTANVKLAVSADGQFLAVAVADAGRNSGRTMVNVWDLRTHQGRLVVADLPVAVGSIAISHDGSQVAIGGAADGRIQLRDARTGELQHELDAIPTPRDAEGRSNAVALAYLDDGRLVVSSLAGRIRFVDPATGHVDGRIFGPAGTSEAAVLVDGAARSMVTIGSRGIMRYELPSGRPLWSAPSTLRCESGAWIAAELDVVLCGEAGGRVVGVDLATGTLVSERFDTQRGNVHLLSSDGTTLLGLANEDAYTVWRLDGVGLITHTVSRRGGGRVLDYLPGHDLLLIAGVDPETRNPVVDLVDTHSGQLVDRFDGAVDARTAGPGRAVVRYDDGTLASYDVDREPSAGPRVHAGATFDDFAAIGDRAYVWQRDGQVRRVDLVTGVVTGIDIADPADLRIVIDANTEQLYTLSGEALQRRNPTSGRVLATADVPHVANIAVRGRTLIANTADGELTVLDADTLVATGDRFAATTGAQPSIELDGGGSRIVTQGNDGSVRFYDVASGTQLGTELTFGIAAGAAISDDGLQAAIATDAGIVIWDLDPIRWAEAACELAGRNLTQAEWDTYIGELGDYRPTCPDVT